MILTFNSTYKASLQKDMNGHMSGVTKSVMNSPCVDCQTGKTVSRVLSEQKSNNSNRGGRNNRGKGKWDWSRGKNRDYNRNKPYGRGRGNRGRGRNGYSGNGYNGRGNQKDNYERRDSSSNGQGAPKTSGS